MNKSNKIIQNKMFKFVTLFVVFYDHDFRAPMPLKT